MHPFFAGPLLWCRRRTLCVGNVITDSCRLCEAHLVCESHGCSGQHPSDGVSCLQAAEGVANIAYCLHSNVYVICDLIAAFFL